MPPTGKFSGLNFSEHEVVFWTPDLVLGEGFRCIRGEFATFWKRGRISREVNSFTSKCWVVHHESSLAAYITLLMDKLSMEAPILQGENIQYKTFPAVKIGLLGADLRASGSGKRLVEWAIEYVSTTIVHQIGVRFMTVDAFFDIDNNYDASGFYEKLGFLFVNPDEQLPPPDGYRSMYLDLKPFIEAFN